MLALRAQNQKSGSMVKLTINGEQRSFDAPADMPLLWVLRDILGMTGTKFGCGIAQCGYCQPGQIMSAAALLATTPNPDDSDIDAAMAGNICCCGTSSLSRRHDHELQRCRHATGQASLPDLAGRARSVELHARNECGDRQDSSALLVDLPRHLRIPVRRAVRPWSSGARVISNEDISNRF
jgi:isoquinoline 1-oxidoreductase alpha subunit